MSEIKYYANYGKFFGDPYVPVEKLERNLTPAENLRRYCTGQDYEWIPDPLSDMVDLTPDCNPDAVSNEYAGGLDAFGVKWIPNPSNPFLPAFVEPGKAMLEDITEWESLNWPDPDAWPWEECAARYRAAYGDDDRMFRGTILCGYVERIISLMTFEEAAMAMLLEPEAVEAFFNKLTELNLKIMDHYIDDFGCGMLTIMDDWSAQLYPFFSLELVQKLLVPQIKRLADHAHARGCILTQHSCGNGEMLIPAYKATGIDTWAAQMTALDVDRVLDTIGDDFLLEIYPTIPDGIRGEELKAYVREMFEKHCTKHRCLVEMYNFEEDRQLEVRRTIYEVGRELAASGKVK